MNRDQPVSARPLVLLGVLLLGALIFVSACTQSPAVQNVAPGAADPTAQMIYATSSTTVSVFPLTATGAATPTNTITGFTDAHALAFDAAGNIYVSDGEADSIYVLAPGATSAEAATAVITTGLNYPNGIALDSKGKIYVANYDNNSVVVYAASPTSAASPIATIIGEATGLSCPHGIAIDQQSRIYVANFPVEDCDTGASVTGTVTLYAANPAGTVNATPVATIANAPTGFIEPHGLAFDSAGNLYVTDALAASVTVYAAAGFVTPIRTISGAATGLERPNGIALDASSNIYVADKESSTVLIFKAGANGNVAPMATITGLPTDLHGVTVH